MREATYFQQLDILKSIPVGLWFTLDMFVQLVADHGLAIRRVDASELLIVGRP